MGARTRHYFALMKKNWIIWKRTLAASICELVCPMVLMALLAITRLAISSSIVSATSHISETAVIMPFTDMYTNLTTANATLNATNAKYYNFSTFSEVDFSNYQPI